MVGLSAARGAASAGVAAKSRLGQPPPTLSDVWRESGRVNIVQWTGLILAGIAGLVTLAELINWAGRELRVRRTAS